MNSLFDPEQLPEPFDDPPAQRHSITSVAAADAIKPSAANLRQQVLVFIRASPDGVTDEEIQQGTGIGPSTERPRRIELVKAGAVFDSGRTRATRSGRQAVVWVAGKN